MARIHHHRSPGKAERDVDAAIAVGWARYRVLELRLDELGAQIVRARRIAVAAGTLDPSRSPLAQPVGVHAPTRTAAPRRRRSLVPRIAVARAPTHVL